MGKNITLGSPPVKNAVFTSRRRLSELLQTARRTRQEALAARGPGVGLVYDTPRKVDPLRPACKADAYFRIPRSAEVKASENAGRENSRSAYFMSGAACFGICTP
jgi:hypothetical protein